MGKNIRYYFLLTKMAIIKKTHNNKDYLAKMWRNPNTHTLQNGVVTLENSLAVSQKVSHSYHTRNSTPRYMYPREVKIFIFTKTCM